MVKRSYKHILLSTLFLGASMGASTNVFATDPEVDFSITVSPSLSLSVSSSSVNLPITPDVDGEYDSTYFTITSATNNMYGYTLTMSTEDNHTYLESTTVNPTTGTKPQIQSLTSSQDGISAETFAAATTEANGLNRWGIAIGSGNYNAVTSPKEVKKTTTNNASGVDNTTVNIAAKLNLAVPAGTYKNKFILQMVANPNVGTLEDAYQMAGKTKKTVGNESYYSMQDMNPGICAAAAQSNLQVVDERDNTVYWIGKLADDRCWLLDNLALNLLDSTVQTTMVNNPSYTNADADSLTSLFSGNRANGGQYATAGVSNWTSSYSYSAPLINVSNKDVLPTTYNGTDEPLASTVTSENWKVGVYYNYCAASAGSYCYGSDTSASTTDSTAVDKPNTAIDAEYDICPSGWRMPTVSYDATARPDGGEYLVLYNAYSGTSGTGEGSRYANFRKALRLPLSGDFYDGSVSNQGSNGNFWSSTYYYSSSMYRLNISTSSISPQITSNRSYGQSIRCVAR